MMKKKGLKNQKKTDLVKQALLRIVGEIANTKQKKEDFSKFSNLTPAGVDSFIYEGKGSFETWTNALMYRFKMQPEEIVEKLPLLLESFQDKHPENESDKLWRDLKAELTEEEKVLYLTMIRMNHELLKRKSASKKGESPNA